MARIPPPPLPTKATRLNPYPLALARWRQSSLLPLNSRTLICLLTSSGAMEYYRPVVSALLSIAAMSILAHIQDCTIGWVLRDGGRGYLNNIWRLNQQWAIVKSTSRPPGTEAYPGWWFHTYTLMLERALALTELVENYSWGSKGQTGFKACNHWHQAGDVLLRILLT